MPAPVARGPVALRPPTFQPPARLGAPAACCASPLRPRFLLRQVRAAPVWSHRPSQSRATRPRPKPPPADSSQS
eukprot:2100437-Prymnesium_polylepis.1